LLHGGIVNLHDVRDAYKYNSTRVSDSTQLLALAGIGVIWVLRVEKSSEAITSSLLLPLLLFVACLSCHFLHYVAATISWGAFHRYKETRLKGDENTTFLAPPWINWPGNLFFIGKVLLVIAGYTTLGTHAISLFQ
jgi:hypothetical protein